ncbi:MAG: hypothetical protein V2I43_19295, partial [Parvularcula sp.]|nr:hypothetical protein [Parvularcula sp.]
MRNIRLDTSALALAAGLFLLPGAATAQIADMPVGEPTLLTDPYLQDADETSVKVVWMSNFEGNRNTVILSRDRENRRGQTRFEATTTKVENLFD